MPKSRPVLEKDSKAPYYLLDWVENKFITRIPSPTVEHAKKERAKFSDAYYISIVDSLNNEVVDKLP